MSGGGFCASAVPAPQASSAARRRVWAISFMAVNRSDRQCAVGKLTIARTSPRWVTGAGAEPYRSFQSDGAATRVPGERNNQERLNSLSGALLLVLFFAGARLTGAPHDLFLTCCDAA